MRHNPVASPVEKRRAGQVPDKISPQRQKGVQMNTLIIAAFMIGVIVGVFVTKIMGIVIRYMKRRKRERKVKINRDRTFRTWKYKTYMW